MYLSYNEYKNIGGELSETAFKRHIIRAECYLDKETFGRVKSLSPVPDKVRYCIRDIVDMMDSQSGNNVSSWSNDGVSVSYNSQDEQSRAYHSILLEYLSNEVDKDGTPLLYRGVSL